LISILIFKEYAAGRVDHAMDWLLRMDTEFFRFVNGKLANPVFDQLMPFLSGNKYFMPALLVGGLIFLWKGRLRAGICALMLALILPLGDGYLCRPIKAVVGRPRPFWTVPEARLLVGKSGSGSFPSSHAANWFAAAMIGFIYFRRSAWLTMPLGSLVSFSRVYNGVHYPGDVIGGAILGAGYAAAGVWGLDALWGWLGSKYFPLWWEKLPSLMYPTRKVAAEGEGEAEPQFRVRGLPPPTEVPHVSQDAHWLRLGYGVIGCLLLARLAYIASPTIQLSEDESYQWLWSKHLDISYFSKPPMIAYTQFLGTSLWGDSVFGIRFFAPVITALLGLLTLRFFAREVNARAGFFLLLIVTATPLLGVGSVLMTVDPLSVLFWTAAMLAGWRAVQDSSRTADWAWMGLWMGLGFLSKYTQLLQLLCWAVFFVLWKPARKQLRRPGPYLALLINLAAITPVALWNWQHQWVTVSHVAADAGMRTAWRPTLRFFGEFLGVEFGLLNPVFFVGATWAAFAMWRRGRQNPKLVYFFSMGTPLFLVYALHSLRSRLLPNWIAPSVLPMFFVMVIYWDMRWRLGEARPRAWLAGGLALGMVVVMIAHNTDLITKLTGYRLNVQQDPLHRVRGWDETARVVGQVREGLLAEGKPVFIIGDHYGITSQVTFNLPEARAGVPDAPLAYFRRTTQAQNQFFFWPSYGNRKGENAVFFVELDRKTLERVKPPASILSEFESVTEIGVSNVMYHGYILRPLQFFACRGLK
jgi:membrane-associated phospholipid phosphatase